MSVDTRASDDHTSPSGLEKRKRRHRVCKSWNGYGALVEEDETQLDGMKPPSQWSLKPAGSSSGSDVEVFSPSRIPLIQEHLPEDVTRSCGSYKVANPSPWQPKTRFKSIFRDSPSTSRSIRTVSTSDVSNAWQPPTDDPATSLSWNLLSRNYVTPSTSKVVDPTCSSSSDTLPNPSRGKSRSGVRPLSMLHGKESSFSLSSSSTPSLALPGLPTPMRKCATLGSLYACNRLRITPTCSRCSSVLSRASSSRYSLNAAGHFEAVRGPSVLCKLCLADTPQRNTCSISQCGCVFCNECMRCYVEFEISEGAYDISCPDAQCAGQGVVSLVEVERLVTRQLMDKYRRFRLNREVDMDVNRLWCPKAGCETVCNICTTGERCLPQSVRCPTCSCNFCSNCKHPWHGGITCEENTRLSNLLTKEPGIPFDNDLIKCCPMCGVPIEKDEGCAQMMCKRCKHVFCWFCLASLDDDFLLRHYDKGPCKNKLGHSRASVIWHRTQVIGIFAGFGILLLVASPLLLLAAPCIVCCKCRVCSGGGKMEADDDDTT